LHATPTPLEELVPEIAPGLATTVLRCLQKRPEERFPDVGELAVALAAHGGGRERLAASDTERTVAAIEVQIDSPRRRPTSSNPTSAPVHTTLISGNSPLPLAVPLQRRSHAVVWGAGMAALLMAASLFVGLRPTTLEEVGGAVQDVRAVALGVAREGRLAIGPELRTEREDEMIRPAAAPVQIAVAALPTNSAERATEQDGEVHEEAVPLGSAALPVDGLPTRTSIALPRAKRPLDPNLVGIPGEPAFEPEPTEPVSDELVAARQAALEATTATAEAHGEVPADLKDGPAAVELSPKPTKTTEAVASAPVAAPHD
jgi:hypothetical protein